MTGRRRTSGAGCCSVPLAKPPAAIVAAWSRRPYRWRRGAAYGGGLDIGTDLRADDHVAPITELGRLLDLHFLYFERPDPDTLMPIEGALAGDVADALATVGYPPGDYESLDDAFAVVRRQQL